jgi:hypothetical protein
MSEHDEGGEKERNLPSPGHRPEYDIPDPGERPEYPEPSPDNKPGPGGEPAEPPHDPESRVSRSVGIRAAKTPNGGKGSKWP